MKRVTGIGGIFFKTPDPKKTRVWYSKHLGFDTDDYGTSFEWKNNAKTTGFTAWSTFGEGSNYFGEGGQAFMINYRVADLEALIKVLKEEGVQVVKEIETYEYGKFAHILDCDGLRLELWEPCDEEFDKLISARTKPE